ncbi:MAG: hypothetical protein JWM97_416 [Phycisphaerales bacterium]|nr:hypothetical protein [Phycisphaerales bacterium]
MANTLPALSPGNLVQDINPWTWLGNQMGFININTQASGDPALEAQIAERVASYGRQLGRISDVVEVLLKTLKLDDGARQGLSDDDRLAIQAFTSMLREIQKVKAQAAPTEALVREVQRLKTEIAQMQSRNGRAKSPKRPTAPGRKRSA